jgi:iron complex transport system ATP-binding protein
MTALELQGVSVSLAGRRVLEDVSLDVAGGSMTALVGGNGAGKTTLLRAALGLTAHEGRCLIFGRRWRGSPGGRASRVGYLAQEPPDRLGHDGRRSPPWAPAACRPKQADAAANCGRWSGGGRRPEPSVRCSTMSGRRAGAGAAGAVLATRAPLLVLASPSRPRSPTPRLATLDLLAARGGRGRAVLMTLHDLSLAARYCDRAVRCRRAGALDRRSPRGAVPEVLRAGFGLDAAWVQTEAGPLLSARRSRTGP